MQGLKLPQVLAAGFRVCGGTSGLGFRVRVLMAQTLLPQL